MYCFFKRNIRRVKISFLPFLGGNAIKFETVEPHLKYLRLITVNFCDKLISFDSEGRLNGLDN
uniref:Uncharacterized protein n=2 Tax=Canis lupus familiaris TaxID=9615 RepID=A0A8C0RCT9_CANLF